MAEIKAIETIYNGYRFRSRLEARWAVFFDAAGIVYQYEVEGFTNKRGDCYLPDFFLPKSNTWVEVKGDPQALSRDYQKMNTMLRDGEMLPGFKDSLFNDGGLLLLGNIPNADRCAIHFHPIIQHDTDSGLHLSWVEFAHRIGRYMRIDDISSGYIHTITGIDVMPEQCIDQEDNGDAWVVETRSIPSCHCYAQIKGAYIAARQSRFEHGQKG